MRQASSPTQAAAQPAAAARTRKVFARCRALTGLPPGPARYAATPHGAPRWAAAQTCPLRGDASRRAALGCRPDPPATRRRLTARRAGLPPRPARYAATPHGAPRWAAAQTRPLRGDASRPAALGCRPDPPATRRRLTARRAGLPPRPARYAATPHGPPRWAAAQTRPLRGDASRPAALGCRPDLPRTPRQHHNPMRQASSPTPAASRVANTGSSGADA